MRHRVCIWGASGPTNSRVALFCLLEIELELGAEFKNTGSLTNLGFLPKKFSSRWEIVETEGVFLRLRERALIVDPFLRDDEFLEVEMGRNVREGVFFAAVFFVGSKFTELVSLK